MRNNQLANISNEQENIPVAPASQSSLDRLLRVIDLFTPERPEWTADEIGEVMGVSRATQYRYIKTLSNSGLLSSAGEGSYRLGPRFIVLDRQIRLSDPLLKFGPAVMAKACKTLGNAQLLCTYFRDEVICIHQESVDPEIHSSMERGRPFPLFKGSPSRAILAWLPASHLRTLMLSHAHEIREAKLGENWSQFRQLLKEIRTTGYYVGRGEIDKNLMGVAVPILPRTRDQVVGSLTTILPLQKLEADMLAHYIKVTKDAAEEIAERLSESEDAARGTSK